MRTKLAFLLFLLLSSSVFAAWETEFFWKGQISLHAEKTMLNAGETLNLDVKIDNLADAPLADAYLVFQLVHIADGNEFLFQRENIIAEKISERYSLRGKESKTVAFALKIPEYAPAGNYRLDVYLKNLRSYVVGVPHIFVYPTSIDLTISNNATQRDVVIDRKNTLICGPLSEANFKTDCYSGPVGVIVGPEKEITMTVALKNNSSKEEQNLKLKVVFYHYDDTILEAAVKEFTIEIDSIAPNSSWKKDVKLLTPKKPGAYPIRMELTDAKGNMLSIFRHRVNVEGMSSRFVFAYPDSIYYNKGDKAKILVKFLSPSDAKTEGQATIEVYLMKGITRLYSEKRTVELSQKVPIRTEEFVFNINEPLQDFILGATIVDSANNVLDSYEQPFYYNKFSKALKSLEIITSPDAEFKTLADSFIFGTPIYVKAKGIDEKGSEVDVEGNIYISSDKISLGPYELENSAYKIEALNAGTYVLRCEAYNKNAEKNLFIENPANLVVKSYGSSEYSEEKTSFSEGAPIYFSAYAVDSKGKTYEVPVEYYIVGNQFSLGPFSFSGKTTFDKMLPAGQYTAMFSAAGLSKNINIAVVAAQQTPKETPQKVTPSASIVQKPTQKPKETPKIPVETPAEMPEEEKPVFADLGLVIVLILTIFLVVALGVFYLRKMRKMQS